MRRGFTIVELLLAIVVIAILAAILFPIVAAAKAAGKATARAADYRTLSLSLNLYSEDADDRYCPSTMARKPWTVRLASYLKDAPVVGPKGTPPSSLTIGLSLATAIDPTGCGMERAGCLGFRDALAISAIEKKEVAILLAGTPGGKDGSRYAGWEFSPYNGPSGKRPLVSDRDLVASLPHLPVRMLKPVRAEYGADGTGDGQTPVLFAAGNVKTFTANRLADDPAFDWALR